MAKLVMRCMECGKQLSRFFRTCPRCKSGDVEIVE